MNSVVYLKAIPTGFIPPLIIFLPYEHPYGINVETKTSKPRRGDRLVKKKTYNTNHKPHRGELMVYA
jgi:hypothetical protein